MNSTSHNLIARLQANAICAPDRIAFQFVGAVFGKLSSVTYKELDRHVARLANELSLKFKEGDRLVLLYPQSVDFVVAFLACLKARLVAVPLSLPLHRQEQLRLLGALDDCSASGILTLSMVALAPAGAMLAQIRPHLQWILTDADTDDAFIGQVYELTPFTTDDARLAFLQYTSGSTGLPKGVRVTHGNLRANLDMIEASFRSDVRSCVSWLPLHHDMGLIGCILQVIWVEGTCFLMSPLDFLKRPMAWLEAIHVHQAAISGGPNFAYELCVKKSSDEDIARLDLSHWEIAFCGAEPVRAETLERFAARFAKAGFHFRRFFPCYGLAEATLFVSGGPVGRPPCVMSVSAEAMQRGEIHLEASKEDASPQVLRLVSSGSIAESLKVSIVEPRTRLELAPGQVGEIWVRGESVALGYWNNPAATHETFEARKDDDPRPYMRSGDLGFVSNDGQLIVTGRIKDLIILRGRNYYPQDIETAIEQACPFVRKGCSAAFAIDEEQGAWIVAEVRPDMDSLLNVTELRQTVGKLLMQSCGLPLHGLTLVEPGQVPKTTSGKLRRQDCKHALLERSLVEVRTEDDGALQD